MLKSLCPDLLKVNYTKAEDEAGKPLPFDPTRSYNLYKGLFGQFEDVIKDKHHLLIVPSGPLTQLPFQVLVTDPPATQVPTSASASVPSAARPHMVCRNQSESSGFELRFWRPRS